MSHRKVILKVHLEACLIAANGRIDKATATAINEYFFEVLIAPSFEDDALRVLKVKKEQDTSQVQAGYESCLEIKQIKT